MKFYKSSSFWISFTVAMIIGLATTGLALAISQNVSLLGWVDATFFGAVILFGYGWIILVSTIGLFDMLFYSTAAFATTVLRRKKMRNYYEYTQRERKVDKLFFKGTAAAFLLFLVVALILYFIYI